MNIFLAAKLHGSKSELTREVKQIMQSHSPSGWMRLNMNGGDKNGMIVSCGGMLRGCTGKWLAGFSRYLSSCSVYIVELWCVG